MGEEYQRVIMNRAVEFATEEAMKKALAMDGTEVRSIELTHV